MEGKIKIFLADASRDFLALLSAGLGAQPDLEIVGTADRGDAAYTLLCAARPDVLVTDVLLPGLDGMGLLRRLKHERAMPRTVLLSAFISDNLAQAATRLSVDDYLLKPCELPELARRIREICGGETEYRRIADYDHAIREALLKYGVTSHLSGHRYLLEGIYRALEDRSVLRGITKILYPDLAKHFGTTPDCVERSMRSAVEKGWKMSSPESRRAYFGELFDAFDKSPSNNRFITAVADFIEMNFEKKDVWKVK